MKTVNLKFADRVGLDDSRIDVRNDLLAVITAEGEFYAGQDTEIEMGEDYWGTWFIHGIWADASGAVWWLLDYEPQSEGDRDIDFDDDDDGFGRDW
ncbi:hypothetical protein HOU03_gp062 [Caulobacter phage CcrSC]|uniref:Uncharacterized protein n=1 Tax=Caulobacter phage CcrSC TaxID=2283272 RepID=A0A385ECN2_9CAUD|nr:hypothetical protein HOU03_gp062 [Caulobacter phage CcrSC]AXQ69644.1 hypothetical protein CcrSC_gp062c [Caulobacter phage CcrSC]